MNNSEILDKIDVGGKIWKVIMKRRFRIIGHNLRYSEMVSYILEKMIEENN